MVKILCGCGCGKMFNKYDKRGRERRFVHGHGNKGKHNIIINKGNLGKNPNSHGNVKGKHWKIKDTSKMKGHKIWCEGQRSGVDKSCEICGKEFYKFPCQINRKYCSYKCAGISRIGKSCLNKGFKHTDIAIEKIKQARAKQIIGHRSPETIRKMKEGMKKTWRNPAMREAARQRRMKQILPVKDTSIELKIQKFLSLLHIEYFTHKYIKINHGYQCDILIPEQEGINQKIIIECDGCYWHGCKICNLNKPKKLEEQKERDKLRTNELINKGFKVLRLWEHEIKIMELNDLRDKIYG